MKRIAILFEFGTLNGGEHSMLSVVDRLTRESLFEFVAIAPESGRLSEALCDRGIEQVPFVLRDEAGTRLSRETVCENLLSAIKQSAPNLVHANSLSMGRLTGAIADELNIPVISHLRDIIGLSKSAIADLNRNRLLITVSAATKSYHVSQGLDIEKACVVYNGVDLEKFQPRKSTGVLAQELGLPSDGFLIATIGQIGLRKGQDVLAEAAILAAERLPNAHYLLVGERNSTKQESIDFERNIVQRFEEAGLGERLHRLGYRTDVDRILNEVDLLVHPAHQEPLGRVLLEAAAAGLSMVATNVGGTGEIVEHNKSALLVMPEDPIALANAIVELQGDSAKRQRLATTARQRIEASFNIDNAAQRLAEVWNKMLSTALS